MTISTNNINLIHPHMFTLACETETSPAWRIIPVSKWLVTRICKPFRPFIRGITPFRGLTNHVFINHLLTGMVLQVCLPRKVLKDVRARGRHLDGVLIETTGLADPSPIASTFFLDPFMQEKLGGHVFFVKRPQGGPKNQL